MNNNKHPDAIYCSFISRYGYKTGGHIEIESDLAFFSKRFNITTCEPHPQNTKTRNNRDDEYRTKRTKSRFYYTKGIWSVFPIFGKRGPIPNALLEHHRYIIITDSRCIIPFIQSFFTGKYIIFKSHGSMSAYFGSYMIGALLYESHYAKRLLLSLSYAFLTLIFLGIENIIYIKSKEVYFMRTKESLQNTIFGRVLIYLYGKKLVYGACFTALSNKCFAYSKIRTNENKTDSKILGNKQTNSISNIGIANKKSKKIINYKRRFLILGDWTLPNNIYSLKSFLITARFQSNDELRIAGKINLQNFKKELKLFKSNNAINPKLLGYVKISLLEKLKLKSDYILCINLYGSGIPIKVIEAIKDSKKYGYTTLLSRYSASSIEGYAINNPYKVYNKLNTENLK